MNFLDERLPARFWDKVQPCPMSGCWIWIGHARRYGGFNLDGEHRKAHRVAYEALVDVIPSGLELDHRCRVTVCVNPAHLEAVTHRENVLRGNALAAQNARRTHCARGHELTIVGVDARSGHPERRCRVCQREYRREYQPLYQSANRERCNEYARAYRARLRAKGAQ